MIVPTPWRIVGAAEALPFSFDAYVTLKRASISDKILFRDADRVEVLAARLVSGDHDVLLAGDDRMRGFLEGRKNGMEATVELVYVEPGQRNWGIGTALLEAYIARCAQAGVRVLEASVGPSNEPSRRMLYRVAATRGQFDALDGTRYELRLDHP